MHVRHQHTSIWILLCVMVASSTLLHGATIRLKSPVMVTGSVVCLGDIADIQEADAALAARLKAISLAPAAAPGRSTRLDFDAIRTRLESQGINMSSLEFSGDSLVTVTTPAVPVEHKTKAPIAAKVPFTPPNVPVTDSLQKRIEELVVQAVTRHLSQRVQHLGSVTVAVVLTNEQLSTLSKCGFTRYEATGGQAPWTDPQTFALHFIDRQQAPQTLQVVCQITPRPKVLVPLRNLPNGYVVQQEDLTWKQIAKEEDIGSAITRIDAVVGFETKRSLRMGESISEDEIRPVPLVRRGEIVSVIARHGGITVRMEAKAQGDGASGQQIMLSTLDGKQKISARVTGYHLAEVVKGGSPERAPAEGGIKYMTAAEAKVPAQ